MSKSIFWSTDVYGRLIGGLIAWIIINKLDGYLFASITALLAATGFGITFLVSPGHEYILYIATGLIGLASGGWWVIVPQIILNDLGTHYFETLWGITLNFNIIGMYIFDKSYYWLANLNNFTNSSK